jgi:hypothetical protein
MKKFSIFLMVFMAAMLLTGYLYASVTELSQTYTIQNTAATDLTTYISTTTFIPGIHKIVSVTVRPIAGAPAWRAKGALATLYDASEVAEIVNSNLITTIEAAANETKDKFFPYPQTVGDQLAVVQSADSIVAIEYTR